MHANFGPGSPAGTQFHTVARRIPRRPADVAALEPEEPLPSA